MSRKPDSVHIECGEQLAALLEQALRRHGQLLPVTPEQLSVERVHYASLEAEQPGKRLPAWYDDPVAVLKRGRYLIAHPPSVKMKSAPESSIVSALAVAARNGHNISPEVRATMDADRRKSEST
jgi:hypothetical protein